MSHRMHRWSVALAALFLSGLAYVLTVQRPGLPSEGDRPVASGTSGTALAPPAPGSIRQAEPNGAGGAALPDSNPREVSIAVPTEEDPAPHASLLVRVFDESSAPISGCVVVVGTSEYARNPKPRITNDAGECLFDLHPSALPLVYASIVDPSGAHARAMPNFLPYPEALEYDEAARLFVVNETLHPGGALAVRVHEVGGDPMVGYRVELWAVHRQRARGDWSRWWAYTDGEGLAVFPGLRAGTWGYFSEEQMNCDHGHERTIEVVAGETAHGSLVVERFPLEETVSGVFPQLASAKIDEDHFLHDFHIERSDGRYEGHFIHEGGRFFLSNPVPGLRLRVLGPDNSASPWFPIQKGDHALAVDLVWITRE